MIQNKKQAFEIYAYNKKTGKTTKHRQCTKTMQGAINYIAYQRRYTPLYHIRFIIKAYEPHIDFTPTFYDTLAYAIAPSGADNNYQGYKV